MNEAKVETEGSGVRSETQGRIGRVAIERPTRRNALTYEAVRALRSAVDEMVANEDVRCVILTGTNGAFCAGADLKEVAPTLDDDPQDWFRRVVDELHPLIETLHTGPTPVVTAIGGPVAGGGLGLALAGDVRVASTAASFRSAYLRIGLSPDGASTYLLDRLLGLTGAQRFLLLDEPMSAEEALEAGLVHAVVPPDDLEREAMGYAARLASLPRGSVAAARGLLAKAGAADAETQMKAERDALLSVAAHPDAKEGIHAFVEKRRPDFEGLKETPR